MHDLVAEFRGLAMVWEADRACGTSHEPSSIPDFNDFRARSRSSASLTAITATEVNVTPANADPERLAVLAVTANYFGTVGLLPLAGRTFTAEEDQPGGARSVIISEALWARHFQRSPDTVGRTLRVHDVDFTVIGVMPNVADFGVPQVLGRADYGRSFADRGGRAQGMILEFSLTATRAAVQRRLLPPSAGAVAVVGPLPHFMAGLQRPHNRILW